jgi:putative ABC transport system permease protein
VKRSERIYRWLLRLYPGDFREEYGQEMSLLFRARASDGSLRLWLQVLGDLLFHAPQEHWSTVKQDLRYAIRQLRRNPGFAAAAIVTLAVGIGGTTAVFSVFQAVLLAPLPYEEAGQLVRFYQQEPDKPTTRHYLTGAHFAFLRKEATSFEAVAALANYRDTAGDLVVDGTPQRLRGLRVTSDYFHTLRSDPLRGPGFERGDEMEIRRGSSVGSRRLVLNSNVWRARFGQDPSIIGSTVQLNGEPYEIVGVAPEGFEDPIVGAVDVWVPHGLGRDTNPENNSLSAIGRLRKGVSLEQAREELSSLSRSMRERWPGVRLSAVDAVPLQDDLVAPARGPLHLLLIAVGLMLLVACVNVANLVLARATGRLGEFAVRQALGAGKRRLVRQMLVESLVVASLGGLLGLVLASVAVSVLRVLGQDAVPRLKEVDFDPVVLGVAALVTVTTAIVFGSVPALRFGHTTPVSALRQQSRTTGSRMLGRVRSGLAAVQLALALTLLTGAGVLLASVYRLHQVNLGFQVDDVLTFEVNLPTVRYDATRRAVFHEELAQRLQTIPGVIAAGAISFLPATGSYHGWNTSILSGPKAGTQVARRDGFNIQQRTVSGDFFAALQIPVLAGRRFDARDHAGAPSRSVVSAHFARVAFPGMPFAAVVGQRIVAGGRPPLEIIGVVGDVVLDVCGAPSLVVYHPHAQFADDRNWMLSQVILTQLPPQRLLAEVRAVVAASDPELAVHQAVPLAEVLGRGTRRERFALILLTTFAAVCLLLAAVGLYGVLAYAVRQRTQEIGVRIALGATAGQIRWTVLRLASIPLGAGLIAGALGALMLGRWLTSLAFGISPSDPRIVMAAAAVLTATGMVATWLPARRAARIEPRVAIQEG